jgi:ABC-2 type transport system ATP-binding protein
MMALEINQVSKTYRGKHGAPIQALKDLSLSVSTGEIFGFLGPNGAGKSTTIKILLDLIRPTEGEAAIMGIRSTLPESRRSVAYLPENPAFYDFLSAEEYLRFVAQTFGIGRMVVNEKIEHSLKLLELWDDRSRPIRGFSKGMVQRLGLAQALIHDPAVYILDEPMSGLDPLGRALVKKIMLDLRGRGKSVFFSTHITADVEAVCDRVGIIVKGMLRCVEQVETVLTRGIVGYHISYRVPGVVEQKDITIPREEVMKAMADLRSAGSEIILLEPIRKDLEAFFLDIVAEKPC